MMYTAATEEIFKIGSTSPAALLFDALDHFEVSKTVDMLKMLFKCSLFPKRKSPKADENIRNIKADLVDAVDCCIEAAGFEFHHYYQRSLLKVSKI